MTTKEKIIRQSIQANKKELDKIEFLLNASPLVEIIELRKSVYGMIDKISTGEMLKVLKEATKKEKELFAIAKKQQDSIALIDRKVNITYGYWRSCRTES
jgi:hypothetical protein